MDGNFGRQISYRVRSLRAGMRRREALRRDYVFIHINKCGGTSVEKALDLPKIHDTARQRIAAIGRDRWNRSATFAVVRHPYGKVASHYRYRIKTNQTALGTAPIGLNEWVRRAYGDHEPRYYDKPLMFAPCLDWVTDDNGEILVNLIIKLEDLSEDWHRVQNLTGARADLPMLNATRRDGSGGEDLDAESMAIIRDRFAPDFLTFGYDA